MPNIDVILHQDTSAWSTWGPPIITAVGSLLVAGIALVGVLIAANRSAAASRDAARESAEAARQAADRSAAALLEVENARAETEHRRHLRVLVSDLNSTCIEYATFLTLAREPTEESVAHFQDLTRRFLSTLFLARMTTSNEVILAAVSNIMDVYKPVPDVIRDKVATRKVGRALMMAAANLASAACDELQD